MDNNIYNEKELLLRIAEGDEKAFADLFDRYKNSIYSLASGIIGSELISKDILQEVFLRIWLKRQNLKTVENFTGYLIIVARRIILNEIRKLERSRNRENIYRAENEVGETDVFTELSRKEYAKIINKARSGLPEQQAAVFQLIKEKGYTREEAADELGLSAETVKKHLERAMRHVKAFLTAHFDDLLIIISTFFIKR